MTTLLCQLPINLSRRPDRNVHNLLLYFQTPMESSLVGKTRMRCLQTRMEDGYSPDFHARTARGFIAISQQNQNLMCSSGDTRRGHQHVHAVRTSLCTDNDNDHSFRKLCSLKALTCSGHLNAIDEETPVSAPASRRPTNLTAISSFTIFAACFNALEHHMLPEQREVTGDHRDQTRKLDEL